MIKDSRSDENREQISEEALIERYGIDRLFICLYQVGEYKYHKLEDAIAQAKRERGIR